jgi:UDP-glucose 4-epimerase
VSELGRALVTGGAGFIGSHLVEALLREGAEVVVIDDYSGSSPQHPADVLDAIETHALDLVRERPDRVLRGRTPDLVFHAAGSVDVPASIDDPRRDFERNVLTTLNLLDAVRAEAPDARFVNLSTAAVYGPTSGRPSKEVDPTCPASPYAVNKLAAEHYVRLAAGLHGLHTASARLFHVFGPRVRRQVVFDLIRKLHENPHELRVDGEGGEEIDLNYVTNVVDALLLVARRAPCDGEVFNVASETTISIADLARAIRELVAPSASLVFGGRERPGTSRVFRADVERLKRLGYRPRIGLEEGLDLTVAWYRREVAKSAPAAVTDTGSRP